MNKNSKTKQQLLLEIEELRTRLDAAQQRLQEANERMQAEITERKRVEEDFVRAQKHAESIVETIREPLLVLTADLKVISANQSFYRTFKVTPKETEGRFIYSVGNHQWDIPALRKLLEEIVPQNSHFNDFEVDHEFPVIGRKTMLLNARRIYRQGKGTEMILLAIEDITERNRAREVLEVSETRYRRLFETAQDGILIVDADTGQISDVNPFLIQMLGYSHEDFLGRKLWEIGAFKDIEASRTAFSELQTRGYVRYEDLPLQTRDGRFIAVEFVSNVYLVDHHKVIQCNIRDLTERKRAEEALLESGEFTRHMIESSNDCIKVLDLEGHLLSMSEGGQKLLEIDDIAPYLNKSWVDFWKGKDREAALEAISKAKKGDAGIFRGYCETAKGTPKWWEIIISPIKDADGSINRLLSVSRDITKRKQAEEALQEKTHELGERVKELNCLYAFSKLIERPDISLPEIFEGLVNIIPPGWQYPEVTCARLVFEDQILKTPNFNETIWKQSSPFLADRRCVGTLEVYYLEERPECDEGPFLKGERDLIDALAGRLGKTIQRKRAEEALRESEERFRLAINATNDGLWEWDIQTDQEFFSPRWCEIIGYSLDDPELPHTYNSWTSRIHPDDYDRVISALNNHLEKGTTYDVDYRHRHKSGEYRWQNSRGQAVFDESGKPTKMVGCISDITERKQAEEALRQGSLELQQLTEALEQRVLERTTELATTNEALRHLSTKLLSAQEDERKRIAGELHDTIGSCLTAIKFKVETVQQQIGNTANVTSDALNTIIPIVQESIDECRRIQMDLRPSMLDDLGLLPTLSWFCRRFQTIYSEIRIEQEIEIKEGEVPPPLKIVVFRVIQETMNNIAKHSHANLVRLSLRKLNDRMELLLQDNGQGFNLEKARSKKTPKRGLGLSSMRERTELSGGSFDIESTEGKGTIIRASWPLRENG